MTADEVVRRHYQCFNERRFDDAIAQIDAEAVFHTIPTRQRLVGIAGYRAIVAAWLHAFVDAQLRIDRLSAAGDVVDVDFMGRGTHTGDLVLGDALSLPATGLVIELPFHDRLEIRDGHIVRAELNFDEQALRRHLFAGH